MIGHLFRESLAIAPPANVSSALAACGVDPRYAFDNQQRTDVVAHCVPAFDHPPLIAPPPVLPVPRHQFFFNRAVFLTTLLTDGIVTIVRGFDAVIRSMCK